ncbi:hypothetical protein [Weissella coleopterorum]|uniref:hypothetical protein n=1 Tax=Weissella coleopterorum TaxID=2714949 RepID=UPI0019803055|nr:hypothetical protein [Weissella coleopterorum]
MIQAVIQIQVVTQVGNQQVTQVVIQVQCHIVILNQSHQVNRHRQVIHNGIQVVIQAVTQVH